MDTRSLQVKYGLSKAVAHSLSLLLLPQPVTFSEVAAVHSTPNAAKISLHRLRQKMEEVGIHINHQRDVGYWLEIADRELLLDVIEHPENHGLPFQGGN